MYTIPRTAPEAPEPAKVLVPLKQDGTYDERIFIVIHSAITLSKLRNKQESFFAQTSLESKIFKYLKKRDYAVEKADMQELIEAYESSEFFEKYG